MWESPLDCKEIQPVHSEGDQPWDFFGRYDAKAETPVLWPPHAKNWLIGKDSDAGRDWGQEEKGMTEDEMAGRHRWLNGRETEWTSGDGDAQGGLACCDSWGRKESDTTEGLNWTELNDEEKKNQCDSWVFGRYYSCLPFAEGLKVGRSLRNYFTQFSNLIDEEVATFLVLSFLFCNVGRLSEILFKP